MKLTYIFAVATVFIFLVLLCFKENPRRFYIVYVFFLFPLMDLPVTSSYWGSFKVFDVLSFASFLVIPKDFFYINKKHKIYFTLFCMLLFSLLIGSLNSNYIKSSLVQILSIFPIFIFCKSLISECTENEAFQSKILWLLKFIAVLSIIFVIIQFFLGLTFTFYSELNQNTIEAGGIRYPSFFSDPQKYGQFLVMLIFLFLINKHQISRPAVKNYLFFGLILFGIAAAGDRSVIFGLFTGLFLLFLFLGPQFKIIIIVASLISFIFYLNFPNSLLIFKRIKHFSNDLSYRSSLWEEAYQIFEKKPLFGIGIDNYKHFEIDHSKKFYITPEKEVVFFDQPESGYLKILSETGCIGLILIFSIILIPVVSTLKYYNQRRKDRQMLYFIAGLSGWLISFTSIYSLSDKRVLIVLITLIGLIIYENTRLVYED